MKFLLYCAKCKHKMQFQARTPGIKGKKKKCVFCNHTILLKEDNIVKRID